MPQLLDSSTKNTIQKYRQELWMPKSPPATLEEAIIWVEKMDFVYFWPIQGVEFPSLWQAVAHNRPVTYGDPANYTWEWKDKSLSMKVWYYAKFLRKKATFLSLKILPFFFALSNNFGDPENDYLEQYRQGTLSMAAKNIYEALLAYGPLNTIDLKQKAKLASTQSESEFNRALEFLQADMKVIPSGIAQAGAWRYAFIYDLVPNQFPSLIDQCRYIETNQARSHILRAYARNVGAFTITEATKLLGWNKEDIRSTSDILINEEFCTQKNDLILLSTIA